MFFLFFSVFIFRSWQLKSPKSATTWNTSSSAPPVTLWNHMTWHSHTFVLLMHTIVASLAHENWIAPIYSVAASVAGTCTCVSWPIRGDWVFRRGALKRQVLKKKKTVDSIVWENGQVFWALKHASNIIVFKDCHLNTHSTCVVRQEFNDEK